MKMLLSETETFGETLSFRGVTFREKFFIKIFVIVCM